MAKVKVKVLRNHYITRIRVQGATYLLDESRVPFLEKQGYIELVKTKKKKDESTDGSTNG